MIPIGSKLAEVVTSSVYMYLPRKDGQLVNESEKVDGN